MWTGNQSGTCVLSCAAFAESSTQGHFFIQGQVPVLKGHSPDKARQRQGRPARKGDLHFAPISESHPVMGDSNLNSRAFQQPRTKPRKSCAFSQILLSVGGKVGEDAVDTILCAHLYQHLVGLPSPQAKVTTFTLGWFERKKSSS